MIRTESRDANETQRLAAALEPWLRNGDLLVMTGDLGAGKTTFVQGLAAAMGIAERVMSPTFTLAATYVGRRTLHHLDVYRLDGPNEVLDLDLPTLLSDAAVVVIEWGERFEDALGASFLRIRIGHDDAAESPDARRFEFEPVGAGWQARFAPIAAALAGVGAAR